MKTVSVVVAVIALAMVGAVLPDSARADGSWLDQQPPARWNTPRMAIPAPPAASAEDLSFVDPRCVDAQRPPETDEDEAVITAGWRLIGAYLSGWSLRVITATSGYDGMCRPIGYQQFVFVHGVFAGTTSPEPMADRFDGAARQPNLTGPDRLFVSYARYSDSDALCCPSRTSFAAFDIDRSSGAPVLTLMSVSTSPNE